MMPPSPTCFAVNTSDNVFVCKNFDFLIRMATAILSISRDVPMFIVWKRDHRLVDLSFSQIVTYR